MITTCPKCNYARQPSDACPDYECPKCGVIYSKVTAADQIKERIRNAIRTGDWSSIPRDQIPPDQIDNVIRTIPVSTTAEIPGKRSVRSIDVITAECAFGMNIFRDLLAGISDVAGGRNKSTQSVLRDARRTALHELRREAFSIGANAIIGIDLDYSEFSGGSKSMLFVVASGTAVVIE